MSVPIAAVDLLWDNLTQLLNHNSDVVADVRENLLRLLPELSSMRSLMGSFAQYNLDSDTMKQTVKEIRLILDETEDAVDNYVLRASVQKSRSLVSRAFHNVTDMPLVFRELEKQIEYMAAKVKQINKETLKRSLEVLEYQEISKLSLSAGKSSEMESPRVGEEILVGFDQEILVGLEQATKAVAELLLQRCDQLEVISIAGMPGLGKTTLSNLVFNHTDVKSEYSTRAFVCVSKEFRKEDVLRRILTSITESKEENTMIDGELEKEVMEQLKDKQYLVVLDDIWEAEDWDMLKGVFPINVNHQCRVLITTTNERVAEYANPKNPESLFRLDFLSPPDSRELLRRRVFKDGVIHESLQEYEEMIAARCDGLPLALVLVAGMLVKRPTSEDWWKAVASSFEDYTARASEGSKLIEMIYENLPNHLKTCFLYLGVFPEGSEIPVWKLVRLWVSEGFVERGGDPNLEDAAEKYLEELVRRNLVMVGRRRFNGRIKSCRVHNSLLGFCKAKASEENLFQEINKDLSLSGGPSLDIDYCRRLCISKASVTGYFVGDPSGQHVRSFLTFVKENQGLEVKNVSAIPKAFKLLRVLEAQSLVFSRFPSDLCNLVLVKYLAISFNDINSIPSAFSTLWNLQTLIVSTKNSALEVKVDLLRMTQFRHFHSNKPASLPIPGSKKPKNIAEESFIQTLCNIAPETCQKPFFDQTTKLKKLGILGAFAKVNGGVDLLQLFSKLELLENLKLLSEDENLMSSFQLKDLPKRLTKLTLMKTRLAWEQMSEIGKLETLEVLKLKEYAFQGAKWNTQKGGFRSLKHLYIGCTDLVKWETSEDHFPNLQHLEDSHVQADVASTASKLREEIIKRKQKQLL